ncbi:MAG: hypothetical protein HZB12_03025 [Candidatus Yonathbacteria bacterium]|nr:hypothetical protein [Candidatus Yonathbacteria bacterium]
MSAIRGSISKKTALLNGAPSTIQKCGMYISSREDIFSSTLVGGQADFGKPEDKCDIAVKRLIPHRLSHDF